MTKCENVLYCVYVLSTFMYQTLSTQSCQILSIQSCQCSYSNTQLVLPNTQYLVLCMSCQCLYTKYSVPSLAKYSVPSLVNVDSKYSASLAKHSVPSLANVVIANTQYLLIDTVISKYKNHGHTNTNLLVGQPSR